MNQELKDKTVKLVQSRIDACHTTLPRPYTSVTPNGVSVDRIGISVFLESDEQIEVIADQLATLSDEGKAGRPDPMIVLVDDDEFVVVGAQLSDQENNFSHQPKVILADHLIGSNAEVTAEDRKKKLTLLKEMREKNKQLRAELNAKKTVLSSVSDDEFERMIS